MKHQITTMADSKYSQSSEELIECGICQLTLEEPKALPCLHSFCLSCLTEWTRQDADSINCPICAKDFLLPPNGVKGLASNVFISKLIQRKSSPVTRTLSKQNKPEIPCTCCGVTQSGVDGYCIDCKGYVCQMCAIMHKTLKPLNHHKIVPMEHIQSGKVDIRSLSKQECCQIHEGQVLWFFCNTCGLIICRDCTVVDHPAGSHKLVNLKSATKEQIDDILSLADSCRIVEQQVVGAIRQADEVKGNLDRALNEAKAGIDKAFNGLVSMLKIKQADLSTQLHFAGLERKKQIDVARDSLVLQHTRLNSALQMSKHVTETGSDYDIALVYSSLKNSLTQLQDIKPNLVQRNLGVLNFKSNQANFSLPRLGTIQLGSCQLVKEFGQDGEGKLNGGRGIAITPDGNIAVADCNSLGKVMIYGKDGRFKFHLDTTEGLKSDQITYPWDIAVSGDGDFFVTHLAPHVNVYGPDGTYKHRFAIVSPSHILSDTEDTSLYGLAMDSNRNLLIGEAKQQYISKHRKDGIHIISFKVTIKPFFIAVTPRDEIIISSQDIPQSIQVLHQTGIVLRTLKPPDNMRACHGLSCTRNYDIYAVHMSAESKGIFSYSASGDVLGCITEELSYPWGIAITDDGKRMMVVENECVKIFSLR
ncbi:E3 ubiquitin-protein ligase TRIM71-like [Amphiura filiformis]|uniref:E3 ubiquitin-protein ligase TRIM71-like n=1 Tax=Amphiura filiformis TaxID=82378 RepID=UPI003B20D7B9